MSSRPDPRDFLVSRAADDPLPRYSTFDSARVEAWLRLRFAAHIMRPHSRRAAAWATNVERIAAEVLRGNRPDADTLRALRGALGLLQAEAVRRGDAFQLAATGRAGDWFDELDAWLVACERVR